MYYLSRYLTIPGKHFHFIVGKGIETQDKKKGQKEVVHQIFLLAGINDKLRLPGVAGKTITVTLSKRDLNDLSRFVNRRLEKWCKRSKRMNLRKSRKWLNTLYKMQPSLFAHWSVSPAY